MPKAKPTPPIANLHDFVEALSPLVRADLDAVSTYRTVKSGERLLRAGVLPQELFQITQGRVKYSAWDHTGRETVLTYMTCGDWVGLSEVFTELPSLWNVVAESPVQVRAIRRREFHKLVETHPELAQRILRLFALRFSLHRLFGLDHSSLTLKERVVKMLYFLSFGHDKESDDSRPVELRLTQEALGKVVGASRQKLNPVLKALQGEQLVEVKFGSLTLRSRAAVVERYAHLLIPGA